MWIKVNTHLSESSLLRGTLIKLLDSLALAREFRFNLHRRTKKSTEHAPPPPPPKERTSGQSENVKNVHFLEDKVPYKVQDRASEREHDGDDSLIVASNLKDQGGGNRKHDESLKHKAKVSKQEQREEESKKEQNLQRENRATHDSDVLLMSRCK
jgi:hypothetical protein